MTVYIVEVSRNGQTEDHFHFCSVGCMREKLRSMGFRADDAVSGERQFQLWGDDFVVIHGEEPAGCETDPECDCETR